MNEFALSTIESRALACLVAGFNRAEARGRTMEGISAGEIAKLIGRESFVVFGMLQGMGTKLDAMDYDFALEKIKRGKGSGYRGKWRLKRRQRRQAAA